MKTFTACLLVAFTAVAFSSSADAQDDRKPTTAVKSRNATTGNGKVDPLTDGLMHQRRSGSKTGKTPAKKQRAVIHYWTPALKDGTHERVISMKAHKRPR